ncbi:hypothetical protein BLGI_607 [Brevibacillus laterosporus GI-9]|nr:hypothetical protein BLGI_607 [Brevibacillus laterosporus GI-9]
MEIIPFIEYTIRYYLDITEFFRKMNFLSITTLELAEFQGAISRLGYILSGTGQGRYRHLI